MKIIFFFAAFLLSALHMTAQWNPNTMVNLEVSPFESSDLHALSTSDGKTWIAYYAVNPSGGYDMYAQLLDAAGNKLLDSAGVLVSTQTSGSATFVFNICKDNSDNLYIGFQYEIAGMLTAVVARVNIDGSLPWGGGVILGDGLSPYPVVNSEGDVIVAWNNNSPATIYIQKLNGNTGAAIYGTPIVVRVGTSNTTRAQLVCHPNGDFTAVFQRKGFGISTTLYANRYTSNGIAVWAAPVQVSNLTSSAARYYCILSIGNTAYYGYYVSGVTNGFASFLQKIHQDGSLPWGINGSSFSSYSIAGDPMPMYTSIAYAPGSNRIWAACSVSDPSQSNYGVYVQRFDTATGNVQLNPLGKEVYPISAARDQLCGDLALIDDAPFLMSYEDVTYKIYATLLDTLGNFVWQGNRKEVSSTTTGMASPKGRFAFTQSVLGQSVAVWNEDRGSGAKEYAQNVTQQGPLPVSMQYFIGVKQNGSALLKWMTASETNNNGFEIRRSADGREYAPIGFVKSKAPGGSATGELRYEFTDKNPLPGINYYRLKQIDIDGRSTVSDIVVLDFSKKTTGYVPAVFPIPATKEISIVAAAAESGRWTFTLINPAGAVIKRLEAAVSQGNNQLKMNLEDIPAGTYILNGFSGTERVDSRLIIKN